MINPEDNSLISNTVNFGNIAISLSGGGYRAAAFHLGSLDLLYRVGLLEHITILSTVSGGTITGAKYAVSLSRGESFESFYNQLYHFLLHERLPDYWLKELSNQKQAQKSPSLIAAAAQTYHNKLLNKATFKEIIDSQHHIHLKEIVFNTTELKTGNNFRFRVGAGGFIGNYNIRLPKSVLAEIRVADAIAASSCFPFGFKPLYFPDDFKLTNTNWEELFKQITAPKTREAIRVPSPLVDGGIYDNLGIESIWLADARKNNQYPIKTLIISDTDNIGQEDTLLKVSKLKLPNRLGNITVKQLAKIIRSIFKLFVVVTVALIFYFLFCLAGIIVGVKYAVAEIILIGLISLISFFITWLLKTISNLIDWLIYPDIKQDNSQEILLQNKQESMVNFLQKIVLDWNLLITILGHLTLNELINSLEVRIRSIPALFLAFLKGQRRRNYDIAREISEEIFEKQYIHNHIFDIARANKSKNNSNENLSAMAEIAFKATNTPTTLWFDPNPEKAKEELHNLISCGQFTMCYNLHKFINRFSKESDIELSPQMQEIQSRVEKIWQQLKEDPQTFVRLIK